MKHVTFHLPSFLRRVRIHGGEFDSSARAMNRVSEESSLMTYESAIHAQAEPRIVRGSTIERKYMSTKTTFKRIALVAVAALGFGVLSVVPSQAVAGDITLTATTGTARLTPATGTGETSTGALITVSSLLTAGTNDSITVSFIATGTNPTGSDVRPVMTFIDSTSAANTVVAAKIAAGGSSLTAYSAADSITAGSATSNWVVLPNAGTGPQIVGASFRLFLDSATASVRRAGTYNYLIIAQGYSGGVLNSSLQKTLPVTITIAAAPAAAAAVSGAATAILQSETSTTGNYAWATALSDSVTAGSLVAGTKIGAFQVKNQSAAGVAAVDTVTVTMTGPGYLTTTGLATNITGRSFVVANVESLTANVIADGASGTGTITITTGVGASFVKTVTFFDTRPVTATAVVAKPFIMASTASVSDVFAITVRDTLGNAITQGGVVVTAAPTDTRTTVGGAATCAWNVVGNAYHCGVAGLASDKYGPVAYTITATGTGTNSAVVVRTSATTTFADNIATKAVLAGPATGNPGAEVEYTLTLTEKNGYPVADQTYGVASLGGVLFSATAADRVATGWGSSSPFSASESFTSKSGVITSKGILPIAGTASLSLTLVGDGLQTLAANAIDKSIGKTKVTASTEVTNPGVDAATDAANEATDAANAATDAALAAAEAADAATSAAQEASDAVAALSESVTKLIAGLQAQIKSLAAVVAKIAKKVKA
jgi:trimeric autotransporter adhesin